MTKDPSFAKPFDGAVSRFIEKQAPGKVRRLLENAGKNDILDPSYPYRERLSGKLYDEAYEACQLELAKAQTWYRRTGQRIVVIFEGRDAAGKGGTIGAFLENVNPRYARHVALTAPSEVEAGQWYYQRYIAHLPTSGEMVLYDRSWYNRGVVEHVFGWCTDEQRARFFEQLPGFERALVHEGILFFKIWLAISQPEQLRQFRQRESDPLKQWKLSQTDIDGMARWDDYTAAIKETFELSDLPEARWTVIRADDKRRARLAALQAVLSGLDYPDKQIAAPDPAICGGPELLKA